MKIRIPARLAAWINDSQAAADVRNRTASTTDPDHGICILLNAKRPRRDGSYLLTLTEDHLDSLIITAEAMAIASHGNIGQGDPDALPNYNAAQAVLRAIRKGDRA